MKMSTDILSYFKSKLSDLYPKDELESLAFWTIDHVMGLSRSEWLLNVDRCLTNGEKTDIKEIVRRLSFHEPIQYITEKTHFYGLELTISPYCLIPRPETEELVQWVLEENFKTVLDIGTGSGCIAVALAKHTTANISALDISKQALQIAHLNSAKNNVNVTLYEHDIFDSFDNDETYDIIVSNPPYVLHKEKEYMKSNVLKYEPHLALFVDDSDALLYYKRICEFSHEKLNNGGFIFLEINEQKAAEIQILLENYGFSKVLIKRDMQGKNRMVKAQKKL
ncbi:MAG: peptide chain release factor N(5)-glutamine methyltransferase [Flavobacteriales bacterium]